MSTSATIQQRINKTAYFQQIGYKPHAKQQLFHNSQSRFRIPVCGRRFGKSIMAARELEPQLFLPDKRFWIVGPTYDLGEKEFRYVWQDLIIDQRLGTDSRVKKAFNKRSGDMYIQFPWDTIVEVKSATHPERLVGDALNGVIMSEAAKHTQTTWERYIRPALADNHGWAMFPTTPEGQNWLYKLWLVGKDTDVPEYDSWKFPSWTNPYVYPEGRNDPEILLIERTTTPEWFDQEIAADFNAFLGKIFGEFDENIHVASMKFNPALPNYFGFDWGFVNPFAALEFQVDPSDNVYVWREHYGSYKTLEEHIAVMNSREQPEGYHKDAGYGDSADPEAVRYMSEHFVPTMARDEAKKNWRQGVDLIKRLMKQYPSGLYTKNGDPLMRPRLFIHPRCTNLIREIGQYRGREGTEARDAQDLPQKRSDHTVDALRYGVMHLFELGAKHHLAEVTTPRGFDSESETFFNFPEHEDFGLSLDMRL